MMDMDLGYMSYRPKTDNNFLANHPEILQGEVFYSNSGKDLDLTKKRPELTSLRKGKIAYDISGQRLSDNSIPWFVNGKELRDNDTKEIP